ncbi:MAG: chromosome segregation protein SMC [Syntrophomonadaceae bacterium]|nr:chromosome segregation protein SMC [Syntrophomonadaceae bacterium]
MYLKSLELQGFKSFLEKVRLEFDHGITVIVGPNGSGKSNIADAIRWVMGEQSAKTLRGNKMEDVIFAGSEKRKPLGLAEVSITLDNASGALPLEYKEIAITRRVFRLGESEYFINKTPCRLKDIFDLFADSGIGRESMNLISQGKVEEVLNARAEDRRALIEETAGIVKYRNRKREALRKLEDTQTSLYRLQDLTAELHRQLAQVATEAETARKYKTLKSELDDLEFNYFLNQLRNVSQRLDNANQQLSQLQDDLVAVEVLNSKVQSEASLHRFEMEKAEKQINSTQHSLYECITRLERLEGQIGIAKERKNSLVEQRQKLNSSMTAVQDKLVSWQDQHGLQEASYHKLLAELEEERRILTKYLAELSREEDLLKKYNAKLEQAKGCLYELASRLAGLRNEVMQLNQQGRQAELKEQKLLERKQSLLSEIEQLEGCRDGWLKRSSQVQQRLEAVFCLQSEIGARKKEKQRDLYELQKKVQANEQEVNALSSRLTVLREMAKEGEGLFQGVKTLLQARDKRNHLCREICGVVADLIKVPQELEIAIEVALGSSLQDVVVETDQGAKSCIQFLKENGGGRATFLPLNTIKPRKLPLEGNSLLGKPGIIGVASQLVQADEKIQQVLHHLLGNLLVVQNIEVGLKVAAATGYSIRMVTLEGEMLNYGGSITGGSARQKRGSLLARNRDITETASRLAEQIKNLAQRKEILSEAETKLQLETAEWDSLQAELRQLELTAASNATEGDRLQDGQNRLGIELNAIELEQEELGTERARIFSRLQTGRQLLAKGEQEELELKREIEQMQVEEKTVQTGNRTLSEIVTETKVKLARLQQEELGQKESMQQYFKAQEEYLAELAKLGEEITETDQRLAENDKDLASCQTAASALMITKKALEQEVAVQREDLKSHREWLGRLELESRQVEERFAEIRGLAHQKELEKTRLDGEFQSGCDILKDKWKIEFVSAVTNRPGKLPAGGFVQRIRQLQQDIAGLGQVHLGAIAEFERLEERLSFLRGQNEDLEEAKSMLLQGINEVDQVIAKRFLSTFQKVADSFSKTFCSLFGGGYAYLSLTEPENLLETGIEISAQPPGKKLQNLNALSGGERALTAIALLFAVLYSRPSPFCVLDEIDASLDEANVERFAFFLKELSQDTQFIIISHRQGTMETANRLYGVSMEEPGISKMISVKLVDGGISQAS